VEESAALTLPWGKQIFVVLLAQPIHFLLPPHSLSFQAEDWRRLTQDHIPYELVPATLRHEIVREPGQLPLLDLRQTTSKKYSDLPTTKEGEACLLMDRMCIDHFRSGCALIPFGIVTSFNSRPCLPLLDHTGL